MDLFNMGVVLMCVSVVVIGLAVFGQIIDPD